MRIIVYNASEEDWAVHLKCGYTDIVVEKGETQEIIYHGDGEWSVEVEEK